MSPLPLSTYTSHPQMTPMTQIIHGLYWAFICDICVICGKKESEPASPIYDIGVICGKNRATGAPHNATPTTRIHLRHQRHLRKKGKRAGEPIYDISASGKTTADYIRQRCHRTW